MIQPLPKTTLKQAPRRESVYDQVVSQIRNSIRTGELTPGDQLLPERELAETLGVSRTSIRQALAKLDGMGIVEITPRDGIYVRRRDLQEEVMALTQVLSEEREQIAHLFEVRQIIETQAVQLAAMRRTEADISRLHELNQQFEAELFCGNFGFEANTHFHLAIVETAKNPVLTKIMSTVLAATMEVYLLARQRSLAHNKNLYRFVQEHQQIVEAIAQQDVELAVSLLVRHIGEAQERIESIEG